MKRKHIGVLAWKKVAHIGGWAGMSSGNALINRFCDAVEDGTTPDNDDMETLASALSVFRRGVADQKKLASFAHQIGLKKRQGKKSSSTVGWYQEASSIVRYFALKDSYVAEGETLKDAEIAARSLIRSELGIGDRAMRNKISKYRSVAEKMYEVARWQVPAE